MSITDEQTTTDKIVLYDNQIYARALPLSISSVWFIVPVHPWKIRAPSELLYNSKSPQVSMVYRLIKHLGCW